MATVSDVFQGFDCTIIGDASEEVKGLAYRSDCVKPGDVFFCIVGLKVDGHSFAGDAINRGASVIVAERKLYLAETDNVTVVVVDDSRKAMAHVADRFYGSPSKEVSLVGVTGTNGKTTTTYLIEQIARAAGKRTGVIGTIGVQIAGKREPASHTTPESPDLQEMLARMRDAHCDVVSMEVSSHALDLLRTWHTTFAVTAFSNLTRDHLDYHHTFQAYFEAKALLFSSDYPAKRVICIDDEWGRELHRRCVANDDWVITTGFNANAQIHPIQVDLRSDGTHLVLDVRGRRVELDYSLVGRFNVENVMCAYGIALALGISHETVRKALANVLQVPGRLERVKAAHDGGVSVFVDYAHTPDALEKALASVKALGDGRTIVVFGCGGDRDASKRSIMGRTALSADYVLVTSDNPRSEDPNDIIADIVSGMADGTGRYEVIPDRRQAIARAIACAHEGDSILIAGKGHEDYQILGTETIHFDDREVAADELNRAFAE